MRKDWTVCATSTSSVRDMRLACSGNKTRMTAREEEVAMEEGEEAAEEVEEEEEEEVDTAVEDEATPVLSGLEEREGA